MTYSRNIGFRTGLGGTWDDALSVVKAAGSVVDPYLPEALCLVDKVRALRRNRTWMQQIMGTPPQAAVPVCGVTPPGMGGVGVEVLMTPLRAVAYMEENPLVVVAGVLAVLLIPAMIGYSIGSNK